MAKAKRVKAPPVKTPPDKIVLELSIPEAAAIYALCGRVTGSSSLSPRGHTSAVWHQLLNLGLDTEPETRLLSGKRNPVSFSFDDYSTSELSERQPEKHPWS